MGIEDLFLKLLRPENNTGIYKEKSQSKGKEFRTFTEP